jgi:hypothetical protein
VNLPQAPGRPARRAARPLRQGSAHGGPSFAALLSAAPAPAPPSPSPASSGALAAAAAPEPGPPSPALRSLVAAGADAAQPLAIPPGALRSLSETSAGLAGSLEGWLPPSLARAGSIGGGGSVRGGGVAAAALREPGPEWDLQFLARRLAMEGSAHGQQQAARQAAPLGRAARAGR